MTRQRQWTLAIVAMMVAAVAALVLLRRGGAAEDAAPNPTAVVTLAAARNLVLEDVVSAYGVVQADPAGATTVAAPHAMIVARVLVRPGQQVSAGQPLIGVFNAPASQMAFQQAAAAAAAARSDLARVQRLYDDRLAASDLLIGAKKTLAEADAALAAQQAQGAGRTGQTIVAARAGVVTTITAAAGDHIAQDAPLLTLAASGAAKARLALEPGATAVRAGQVVILRPAAGGAQVRTRLLMVAQAADPATRTLDAIAPLNGAPWPIGAAIRGDIVTGSHSGLVAPRASVVFDETGAHLFIVQAGKAHRVFVKTGPDQGDDIEVSGPIAAGSQVAVEGAYELQDGMAVTVRGK